MIGFRKALSGLVVGTAVLSAAPIAAQAADSPLWEQVGPWQVRVDPSVGNGCYMMSGYGNGTALRVGIDAAHGSSYVVLSNANWTSLEKGKYYDLTATLDNSSPLSWPATAGTLDNGTLVLFVKFTDTSLWRDISGRNVLKIAYQGNPLGTMRLNGTVAAVQSVARCQASFAAAAKPAPTDPFAGSKPVPAPTPTPAKQDPFA
jgi:hypothetical protein